ncbi:FixH family protein [Henriciella marina]|uniref:FixH family protein n=1 Tax=Henriciella marina TaxID=453851 RepID=UPI0003660406|nr:FixH family protein [Henriciella marina]
MTPAATPYRQDPEAKLKGWHVLLIFLAFFGVMFAVNGVFLYNAITSFPGEDIKKSYVQGLDYNDTLEARKEQVAAGWKIRAGVAGDRLRVEMDAPEAMARRELIVTATMRRAVTSHDDVELTLSPDEPGGVFSAALPDLAPGRWDVLVKASTADQDGVAQARKTVVIP